MAYLTKSLRNNREVGITSGEIVLPAHALDGLTDEEVISIIHELYGDLDFLKDYLSGNGGDFRTIGEAREYVQLQLQRRRTQEVKTELTRQRRGQFNSQRNQLMLLLIDRDGYICRHPGCTVQEDLTVDHIVALSRGGSDDLANLQLLCRAHNSTKRDL